MEEFDNTMVSDFTDLTELPQETPSIIENEVIITNEKKESVTKKPKIKEGRTTKLAIDREFYNPSFLSEFIDMYQNSPCLWQISSKDYSNNVIKMRAYNELVKLCHKIHPDANVEFVKRKIKNLRTVFKKEHSKVQQSKTSGAGSDEVYTPKLWYYDRLLFTADDIIPRRSLSSIEADIMESIPEDSPQHSTENEESMILPDTVKEKEIEESNNDSLRKGDKPINKKRQKKINEAIEKKRLLQQDEALGLAIEALKKPRIEAPQDEYTAFSVTIAAKLRKMTEDQRLIAELLVNKVMFYGATGQLNGLADISLPQVHNAPMFANNFPNANSSYQQPTYPPHSQQSASYRQPNPPDSQSQNQYTANSFDQNCYQQYP